MIRALWLTSWYPNKLDAMNGDFIQRHAKATSLFCRVDVIHLEPDKQNRLDKKLEVYNKQNENLSETTVLYKINHAPLIGKIFSFRTYVSLFKKFVEEYIAKEGKPDIVHVHVPMKAGLIALWLKRKYNIRYVVTEHWAIYNNIAEKSYTDHNFIFKNYTRKILEESAAFLPVSKSLGISIQQMVCNIPFTVIPNVADTKFFNDDSIDEGKDVFRFVHVSTLKYQKNPDGIIRAFSKFCSEFPSTELIIVGDRSEELEKYAASLNIPSSNISFKGLVSYESVALILKESHAMIMFSRFENLPCVIIEALCCGLPVISTNVGGISELIDQSNGLLINNEDEKALYDAMRQLYFNYKNYNNHLISTSAQEKFSYKTVGKQIEEIYVKTIR